MKKYLILLVFLPLFLVSCSSEGRDTWPPGNLPVFVSFSNTHGGNVADSLGIVQYAGTKQIADVDTRDLQVSLVSSEPAGKFIRINDLLWVKNKLMTGTSSSCLFMNIFQDEPPASQVCTLTLSSVKIFGDDKKHTISLRVTAGSSNLLSIEDCKVDGESCPLVRQMSYDKNCHKKVDTGSSLDNHAVNIVIDR